jgi:hypothetical protein
MPSLISIDGLETMISYFNADNFNWVTGIILFANKNASPQINKVMINKGRMKRNKGIPAALMATNSKLSPKFPKVIIEENKSASGKAVGTQNKVTSPTNFKTVRISRPFPTRSSMYNQKNCMVKTKIEIRNAAINGPIKDLIINMSSFFITNLS